MSFQKNTIIAVMIPLSKDQPRISDGYSANFRLYMFNK